MNKIGRKIFYDIGTGEVMLNTSERQGSVIPTTIEREIEIYTVLSERNRDTFDVIELEYGQYAQDFAECSGYRVNSETQELEFSYPDLNQPATEPVYQKPLSVQLAEIKAENESLNLAVIDIYEIILG